jgi:hypothetical protein
MKKFILFLVLGVMAVPAWAEVHVYAAKNSGNSATVTISIRTTTDAECIQKFNELVTKIEVTNRIILQSTACQPGYGSDKYHHAYIYVAAI